MHPFLNFNLEKLLNKLRSKIIELIFNINILIIVSIMTSCSFFDNKIQISNKDVDRTKVPELVIENFITSAYAKSHKIWTLKSQEATSFQDNPVVQLTAINFESYNYQKNITNSSAISDNGYVNNNTRDLTLLSNTIIINNEGTKVSGNYFFWDDTTKRFSSPKKVTIQKKDGSIISGIGFTADQALGNIKFDKQVSGQINDKGEGDENFFDGF